MTRNAELFNTVADLLEVAPDLHKQDVWENECGTQACIAGWTCILGTDDFKYKGKGEIGRWVPKMSTVRKWAREGSIEWELNQALEELQEGEKLPVNKRVSILAGTRYYSGTAEELLGLEPWEANHLFSASHGPLDGLTVAEALREIGKGADIEAVWGEYDYDADEPVDEDACGCRDCR